MRYTFLILVMIFIFAACKKDKYTTAPQISFKSLKPNSWISSNTSIEKEFAPILTLGVTDAEGDLGFKPGSDTSKVYIKNLISNKIDSLFLPDLKSATTSNFKAEIILNLFDFMGGKPNVSTSPRTDTLFFEVYIKDFAKNKSNVLVTSDPVYYIVK
jgi:hypothetical protein